MLPIADTASWLQLAARVWDALPATAAHLDDVCKVRLVPLLLTVFVVGFALGLLTPYVVGLLHLVDLFLHAELARASERLRRRRQAPIPRP